MRGNNTMLNLNFLWRARFKDGAIINQIEDGKERLFKEVKERFNDLEYFYLLGKTLGFTVDLKNGVIQIGHNQKLDDIEKKNKIRLIYFRRNRITLGQQKEELKHEIWYFLGIQYLDENNINRKIILKIDNEGNVLIGD